MSANDRFRRPDPVRAAPLRAWSTLVRPGGAPEPENDHSGNGRRVSNVSVDGGASASTSAPDAEIADAVATAYRVVDRHLSAGREAARALGRTSAEAEGAAARGVDRADNGGFAALGAGLEEMIGEAARAFAGMMPAFAAMMDALARPPYAGFGALIGENGISSFRQNPEAAPGPNFAIEVASVRPARVMLDLAPGADPATLVTTGLHAMEAGRPPITEVAFIPGGVGERPVLSVRVPVTAAPGIYAGAIVDRKNGEPQGALSVKVGE
jgi:hypothetical protein